MEYLILIVSLAGIVFGADYLVAGAVSIARRYKVSDFVIGAAIVGIGTSMPELVVSFIGALNGNADVAIGNVVGSNIFNILGILGLTAVFFPITVTKENLRFEIPLCLAVSILLFILVFNFFDGTIPVISRTDGLILLGCFALFMWYSLYRDRKSGKKSSEATPALNVSYRLWPSFLKVTIGLGVLIVSCDIFVDNMIMVAKSLGINDAFISLTLISCGTSLPEFAASITAALKKNTQLALGNIIGSNIFNITWILGISSQAMPLNTSGITAIDYCVMTASVMVLMILGFGKKIGRVTGGFMFLGFAAYTLYLLKIQIG